MLIENLLNPAHLLVILAVALIVLGPKRLPEAGRGFGAAIRGFKESLSPPERGDERRPMEPSGEPDQNRTAHASVTSTAHLQRAQNGS
jgi:sec-independent protein translocase protein TatA